MLNTAVIVRLYSVGTVIRNGEISSIGTGTMDILGPIRIAMMSLLVKPQVDLKKSRISTTVLIRNPTKRSGGGKNSGIRIKTLAKEIHDLLDLPRDKWGDPRLGRKIIATILTSMKEALYRGEEIYIEGFGTFKTVTRKARRTNFNFVSRNPTHVSTVPMEHEAKKKVIFVPSQILLSMLNLDTPNSKQRRIIAGWL